MSLAELQRAIAELICDKPALESYRQDPAAWLATHPIAAEEADVLRGLDTDSLFAFHEIHGRDRAFFLEVTMPLTLQRQGENGQASYFAAHPYGDDDVRIEAARYLSYLEQVGAELGTTVLARLELAKLLLLDEPVFEPAGEKSVCEPTAAALAPGLAIVPTPLHVPTLTEAPLAQPPAIPGVVLLRRDPDGVTTAWLEGATADLLAAIVSKNVLTIRALLRSSIGQAAYVEIVEQGVVV